MNFDLIYLRMPRTGSTSFSCLENIHSFGGKQLGYWGNDMSAKCSFDKKAINQLKNVIYAKRFKNPIVFSTVRNPFERMVSIWKHKSFKKLETFNEFCKLRYKNMGRMQRWHSQPLHFHLYDINMSVNYVLRLESLQEDFDTMNNKLKLPCKKLPHKNKSKHKHYTEYYDNETKEIVAEKYAKDIEYFNYEFGE